MPQQDDRFFTLIAVFLADSRIFSLRDHFGLVQLLKNPLVDGLGIL